MMPKLIHYARKAVVSMSISASILALANIETIWQEYRHSHSANGFTDVRSVQDFTSEAMPLQDLQPVKPVAHKIKSMAEELQAQLNQDEISESNPFQNLENKEALNEIMGAGVVKFRRESYRSPLYKEEAGYDLLSYEINNEDGSHSSILAYLEKEKSGHGVPFIVLITPGAQGMNSYYFRAGKLLDKSRLSGSEARTLIARHLSGGLPFMSVAR